MGENIEINSIFCFFFSSSFLNRILLYKQNHIKICTHEKGGKKIGRNHLISGYKKNKSCYVLLFHDQFLFLLIALLYSTTFKNKIRVEGKYVS